MRERNAYEERKKKEEKKKKKNVAGFGRGRLTPGLESLLSSVHYTFSGEYPKLRRTWTPGLSLRETLKRVTIADQMHDTAKPKYPISVNAASLPPLFLANNNRCPKKSKGKKERKDERMKNPGQNVCQTFRTRNTAVGFPSFDNSQFLE